MAHADHVETHFMATNFVRDVVIGMADGLTVPFALAAGLSGSGAEHTADRCGGLAEIAAGSIAMGLGGYLAARGDAEHYEQERAREYREIKEIPEEEMAEVARVFQAYGMTEQESTPVVEALSRRPDAWVDFMMRFELGLEEPDPRRAVTSAATIAGSYIAGGMIPLSPYILLSSAVHGLAYSAVVTLAALGYFWVFEGPLYGNWAGAQRIANRGDRRSGGSRGLLAGQADFVMTKCTG